MESSTTKTQTKHRHNGKKSHVSDAATGLLNEGKKFAHEIYHEGLDKVNQAEDNIKEYSDEILMKVKQNPLASVLIAGGIGFLLAKIFTK